MFFLCVLHVSLKSLEVTGCAQSAAQHFSVHLFQHCAVQLCVD